MAPLATSLAAQAAVALENSQLWTEIRTLFEGFVRASVGAIEARDPATSGHSFRVANLTIALAEAADRADSGPLATIRFTREDLRTIRYASLLHDFGKVGVREDVLIKAKKLYPAQLELLRARFALARRGVEVESLQRRLDYALAHGRDGISNTPRASTRCCTTRSPISSGISIPSSAPTSRPCSPTAASSSCARSRR